MTFGDLLSSERIRIPLAAGSLREGVAELLALLPGTPAQGGPGAAEEGARGEASPSGLTRILFMRKAGGEQPRAAIGVASRPLSPASDPRESADAEGASADGTRVVVVVTVTGLRGEARDRIRTAFFQAEIERAILGAESAEALLSIRKLTELELERPLRVEDVMVPLSYRIYPDTPIDEVLDLIARRRLDAVPVVDERLQVLGVISAAEALQHALRRRGKSGVGGRTEGEPTARQIMTRSVLCVSEDQALLDAAQLMANREATRLPVVREGELVGFLTRDGVLASLLGQSEESPESQEATKGDTEP